MFFNYLGSSIILGILMLFAFGVLNWLQIPAGNIVDWLVGIASFWWLLVIVTVPWNIYFDAKEVIAEAAISREKKIAVDEKQFKYVVKVSRWSIIIAIAMHIVSGISLYWLAIAGISKVGYISSGATLLLTFLRPAIRTYQYLASRLTAIRQQIKYPREDVLELRDRFNILEQSVKTLEEKLDLENPHSLVSKQQQEWQETRKNFSYLRATLEQLQAKNAIEHEQLAKEAQNAIAQLTEDSQFLNHAREIIRFFKTA